MSKPEYKSIKIRKELYVELKKLAVEIDVPLGELIKRLYESCDEGSLTSTTQRKELFYAHAHQ